MAHFALSRYGIASGVTILTLVSVAGGLTHAENGATVTAGTKPLVLTQAKTTGTKKTAKKKSTFPTPRTPTTPRGSYEGPPRGSHEGEPHGSFGTNDS